MTPVEKGRVSLSRRSAGARKEEGGSDQRRELRILRSGQVAGVGWAWKTRHEESLRRCFKNK